MGSLRTFLASKTSSRTHFEVPCLVLEDQVLGFDLKASSPQKLPCPRPRTALFFNSWNFVGKRQKPRGKFANTFFVFLYWSIGVISPFHQRQKLNHGNFTNDKNLKKKPIVSSASVSSEYFLLTTVTNNNIEDHGLRPPLNSISASQFKRVSRNKWRVFVLKVAISGPNLAFLWT